MAFLLTITVVFDERHRTQLIEFKASVVLCHNRGIGGCVTSHTTSMERTESQLCTRLTDCLCCDDTDSLSLLHHARSSQIAAITLRTDTLAAFASKHRTNIDGLDACIFNGSCQWLGDFLTGSHDYLTSMGIGNLMYRHTSQDALIKRGDNFIAVFKGGAGKSAKRTAVFLGDNHIVRHIDKTTGQITCVGSLHGGISQTLTCTVRGDKVLEHGHTFLEVR